MTKILENGFLKTADVLRCPFCGCKFEYDGNDVKGKEKWNDDISMDENTISEVKSLYTFPSVVEKKKYLYTTRGFMTNQSFVVCPECTQNIHSGFKQGILFASWGKYQPVTFFSSDFKIDELVKRYFGNNTNKTEYDLFMELNFVERKATAFIFNIGEFKIPAIDLQSYFNSDNRVGSVALNTFAGEGLIFDIDRAIKLNYTKKWQ